MRIKLPRHISKTLMFLIALLIVGGTAGIVAATSASGVIAYWKLDESSGKIAKSDTGVYNGTISGSPTWITGKVGNAVTLNGGDNIAIGDVPAIDNASQATLLGWMKRTAKNSKVMMGKQTTNNDFAIEFYDTDLSFDVSNGAWADGSLTLNDTNWHHVALVYDGTKTGNSNRVTAYVDGSVRSLTYSGTYPAKTTANTTPFNIGKLSNSNSSGSFDDVQLYNRALSASDITAIYTNTTPAPTVSLSANPTSVTQGGSSTLSWSSTNADTCTAGGGWSGSKAVSGSEVRSNLQSTSAYTLTCTGANGSGNASTTVTVTPPAPTVTINANPTQIASGGSSSLAWSSTNATSCTASNGWSGAQATSGTLALQNINATQTYKLTCTGAGGSGNASATVTVVPMPTVSISANPLQIAGGGSSTLTWSSTNATSCAASDGWTGAQPTSGTLALQNITASQTYTLTCSGIGGSGAAAATVTVVPAPVVNLSANVNTVANDGSVTLTWSSTDATSCAASGDWAGARATAGTTTLTHLVQPDKTYTLSCTGIGGSGNAQVVVSVLPPVPTVSLAANPTSVAEGDSSTLTWSSTNADSCTAGGDWNGSKATSGSEAQADLQVPDKTFSLTCTGAGGSASASAQVAVVQPLPPTISLQADSGSITAGGSVTLTWSSSNTTGCTAGGDWSGNLAVSGTRTITNVQQPDKVYLLSCSGPGGAVNAEADVTVVPPPPAPTLTLSSDKPGIVAGDPVTLTWSSANADTCTAFGDWSGTKSVSGSQTLSNVNQPDKAFSLSCTGTGGTVVQLVTVTVAPPPDTQAPTAPTNLTSSAVTHTAATLSWTASTDNTGVTDYTVFRDGNAVGTVTATTFVDSTLAAGTSYSFTVVANDAAGNHSQPSAPLIVTTNAGSYTYPLHLGSDKRHLFDATNKPFLLVGDAAWSLEIEPTDSQVIQYLDDRANKGFTTVLVEVMEHQFDSHGAPKNANGDVPFTTPGDFSTPNEAYFAHLDFVIQQAAQRGILVTLTPDYLGYPGTQEGWYNETIANGVTKSANFGTYLGNRYKNYSNILWVMGGDSPPLSALTEVNAMANAIQASAHGPVLMTAHNSRQQSGVTQYPAGTSWLNVNTTYSNCVESPQRLSDDYARTPTMPFFLIEAWYENEHGTSPTCIRSQAYWSILEGGIGHIFGNNPMWLFGTGWQNALDSQGAQDMGRLSQLMQSRDWSNLVPDTTHSVMTGGYGSIADGSYAAVARTSSNNTVIAYTPNQTALTVDMTKINGSNAHAWWYDPSNSAVTDLGTFATSGFRTFTPPAGNDYILVLDNTADGYGVPANSTNVTYAPPSQIPTVTLTSNKTSLTAGDSLTLSWTSTNATGCTAFGDWSGALSFSGTQTFSNVQQPNKTYSIQCANESGTATQLVSVTVNAPTSSPVACGLANAAFCEDFEGPIANPKTRSGDFNPAKLTGGRMQGASDTGNQIDWTRVANIPAGCRNGSVTNPLPPADFLICDPVASRSTHHALVSATVQNYGDAELRANQPFDFAGRTGTIHMDLSIDDETWLSGSPEFVISDQPNAVASIQDENGKGTGVSNGFIVQFRLDCTAGSNGPMVRMYNNYTESQVADTRYGTNWCDAQNKIQTAIGKMNRFEIKISGNSFEIYGTDYSNDGVTFGAYKKIFSSVPLNLPYSRAWLSFGVHNHASLKYFNKTTEYHYFDNIAFDGPVIPAPTVYQIPNNTQPLDGGMNLGWAYKNRTDPIMAPLTFSNVDKSGATSAKLLFDMYADANLNNLATMTLFYRLNGGAWKQYFVPPGVIANDAMIAHRTMYAVDINPADLVSGNNTIQFSADNIWYGYPAYVANVDLLVSK